MLNSPKNCSTLVIIICNVFMCVHMCLVEQCEENQGTASQTGVPEELVVKKPPFEVIPIVTSKKTTTEGPSPHLSSSMSHTQEKCTKMSEELQGAPQAGKTEVADLEEEFDRASIPTEATKPEATEERKEVSVKSEDIPSPLQNATQLYGNLSDDVSQTKEMHPSSSASESSLNVDPMSKEEPSEKMAASSRFPDSVQELCEGNQGTASQTDELVDKKTPFEVTPIDTSKTEKTEGHDIQSLLDSYNPANCVECPEKVLSPSSYLDSLMQELCEGNYGTASQTGVPEGKEVVVKKSPFQVTPIDTSKTKKTKGRKRAAAKSEVKLPRPHQEEQLAFKDNVSDKPLSIIDTQSLLDSCFIPANTAECPEKVASISPYLSSLLSQAQETDLKMGEKENAAIHIGSLVMKPLLQPIWKQNSSVISQPSLDRHHLTSTDSSDLTKLSENINRLSEVRKVRIEVLNYFMEKMYQGSNADIRVFYCIATLLFRLKQSTSLCPLCLFKKEERIKTKGTTAHPNSHIFPSCTLKGYKCIHCKPWENEFIYDQISRQYKGFATLTFPIFCQVCEFNASKEEGVLKDVYLQITGPKDAVLSSEHYYTVKHILAVVLFRGMLLGVNFLEELQANQDFFNIFKLLREYCSSADYESCWVSKFHVFILGNEHYNLNTKDPKYKYLMELQLRNPQFTTMVRTIEGDVFLYTKFDCFHCVLPIKSTTIEFPRKEAFHKFPQFLWKYNLQQVGTLVSRWISQERTIRAYINDPLDQSLPEPPPSFEVIPAVSDQLKKAENPLDQSKPELPPSIKVIPAVSDQLKKAEYQLKKAEDQLKKAEDQLKQAKDQLKKAKDQKEPEDQLKKAKDQKEAKEQLKKAEDQLKKAEDQLKKDEDQLKEAKDQLKKAKDQLKEAKDQLKEAKDQLEKAEDQLEKAEDQLKEAKDQLKKAKDQKEAKDQLKEAEDQLKKAKYQLKKAKDQVLLTSAQNQSPLAMVNSRDTEEFDLEKEHRDLVDKTKREDSEINRLKGLHANLIKEKDKESQAKMEKSKEKMEKLRIRNQKIFREFEEKEHELEEKKDELEEKKHELEKKNRELQEIDELQQEIKQLKLNHHPLTMDKEELVDDDSGPHELVL